MTATPADALLADTGTLPPPVQALLPATLGLETLQAAALGPEGIGVAAHHIELSEALASVYVLSATALVRLQVAPSGVHQRTVVPLHHLARIDELAEVGGLTVIIELDADQRSLTLVGTSLEGRIELTGTELPNGWVLTAAGDPAPLARFATALRRQLMDPR